MARSAQVDATNLAVEILGNELTPGKRRSGGQALQLQKLEAIRDGLASASDVAQSVERIVVMTADLVRLGILVEAELQKLNLEASIKRERLAAIAPGAIKTLEALGSRIESLVEKAAAIDPRTCPESELHWRNRLMDLAEQHSEALNGALMKLLS